MLQTDVDYQPGIYTIDAHWKGFKDAESGIEYCKVGLGTEPFEEDVRPFVDVGLRTGHFF